MPRYKRSISTHFKHSIHYRELPDYFLVFDIYEKNEKKFLSVKERNKLIEGSGLYTVACIGSVLKPVFLVLRSKETLP